MKETISKVKIIAETGEMGEIIANETRKNLQYIQEAHAAQYQKNKQPNQKWAKELNRHFSKDDIQMASKHMKRCSTSLIIREMQIKTPIRYPQVHGFISGPSILFHWSILLFLCQYHTVLLTVTLQYNLKLGRLIPPAPFFFLKTAWIFRVFCTVGGNVN